MYTKGATCTEHTHCDWPGRSWYEFLPEHALHLCISTQQLPEACSSMLYLWVRSPRMHGNRPGTVQCVPEVPRALFGAAWWTLFNLPCFAELMPRSGAYAQY